MSHRGLQRLCIAFELLPDPLQGRADNQSGHGAGYGRQSQISHHGEHHAQRAGVLLER
jgi:hypothetical protein